MGNLRVLDTFSGIGGMSLGLSWAGGFETVAFCEIEPFCQRVLRKHWPDVPIYDDIRTLTYERLTADGIGPIDVITGGVPCQPASQAGRRKGTDDDRWLWPEAIRTVCEFTPLWVVFENVYGLITLGGGMEFDKVCRDLEALGYEVQAFVIPACGIDAPHRRDRVWIVAYAGCQRRQPKPASVHGDESPYERERVAGAPSSSQGSGDGPVADAISPRLAQRSCQRGDNGSECKAALGGSGPCGNEAVPDASKRRRLHPQPQEPREHPQPQGQAGGCDCTGTRPPGGLAEPRLGDVAPRLPAGLAGRGLDVPALWEPEPDMPRVASGVPNRVHKLRALGNAVVPQIPMILGRMIIEAMQEDSDEAQEGV